MRIATAGPRSFVGAKAWAGPFLCAALAAPTLASAQTPNDTALLGAWSVERYFQADGSVFTVNGRIFFTERDWTVLFFVLDADGEPESGSGEGGTYALQRNDLVFTHHFNLSGERAREGGAGEAPRIVSRTTAAGVEEVCTIELDGNDLTIFFPSGNSMLFRKR